MLFHWFRRLRERVVGLSYGNGRFEACLPKWYQPRLERLEDRLMPAIVNWIGGSGDWNTPGNWDQTGGPGLNDDAVINVTAGITVTHSTSDVNTVNSLTVTNGNFTLSGGGTLDVKSSLSSAGGAFTLLNGTLADAIVAAGTTITVGTGGTLSAVTLHGTLDMQTNSNARVYISGGLSLPGGTIQLGNASGTTTGTLDFTDTTPETIDGTSGNPGTILFGTKQGFGFGGSNGLFSLAGSVLTLGPNLTISGASGYIDTGGTAFDNQATITADPTVLSPPATYGTITLQGTNWTNDGTIQAQNGGSIQLDGTSSATAPAWTNVAGHTISVSGTGALTLEGGQGQAPAPDADGTDWVNLGTILNNASTVNLSDTFTLAALGTLTRTDGSVNLAFYGILNNIGSTFLLGMGTGGSWNLQGTVEGGTVAAMTGYALFGDGGTLNGVTLDGTGAGNNPSPLDMQTNSSYASVLGGLTLRGAIIQLGNASGTTLGELNFNGSSPQFLDSNADSPGSILFGTGPSNLLVSSVNSVLTLGPNLTITGASGSIYAGAAFDNQGTITADPTAMGLGATSGTIRLSGTNWSNDGTIQAQNGGSLDLTGASSTSAPAWTNTAGHTITVSGSGFLTLEGYDPYAPDPNDDTWINSGTITDNASTVNLGGIFTQTTLGNFARTGGTVNLVGTLNNAGSTLLLGTGNAAGSWNLVGERGQSGGTVNGGTVEATPGNALVATGLGGALVGVTLDGTGTNNPTPLDMQTNNSEVDISGGLTLRGATIDVGSARVSGQMTFIGSSPQLIDGVSGNPGTIILYNGSLLGGAAVTGTPNPVTFGPNLTIIVGNGLIDTGSVAFDNQATITVDPTAPATLGTSGSLTVRGTDWINDGAIQAQNGGSLYLNGTSTATAPGWTNGAGHTISVSGNGYFSLAAYGAPTPDANGTTWINDGTLIANGPTVSLGGVFTQAALGTFTRTGGTVTLGGTLNNAGATLLLGAANTAGSWILAGTINGGTVAATPGNSLGCESNEGGTLNAVTLDGTGGNNPSPLDMQTNSCYVSITGGLTLRGATLYMGHAGNGYGLEALSSLSFTGSSPQTVDGVSGYPGTIVFGLGFYVGDANAIYGYAPLTFGLNLTITGGSGDIDTQSAPFDNQGSIIAETGTISLHGTNWTNDGTFEANGQHLYASGTSTNFSGGTLTGGNWKALANGFLTLAGGNITTNAATIVLDGSNAGFLTDTNVNALAGFVTNTAAGSFTIQNGRSFTTAGSFSNLGSLSIGTGSIFATSSGGYSQGGSAALDIEVDGAGTSSGQLKIAGNASLSGTLNVSVATGFQPSVGDSYLIMSFALVSGDFLIENGLSVAGGLSLTPVYAPSSNSTSLSLVVSGNALIARPDAFTTEVNTTLFLPLSSVLSNDTPPTGARPLVVSTTTNGTLYLNSDGLTYIPNKDFTGTDTFTCQDTDNSGALSNVVTDTISVTGTVRLASKTFLVAPATWVLGQTVVFTAIVKPAGPAVATPTGIVIFTVDGTAQAPVNLVGAVAYFITSALNSASDNVRASYQGDGSFAASESITLGQTSNVRMQVNGTSPQLVEGTSFTGTVATFTTTNKANTATDFTATINWNDGTISDGTVGQSAAPVVPASELGKVQPRSLVTSAAASAAASFTVAGNHTYLTAGSFMVTVTVTDVGSGTATTSVFSAAVQPGVGLVLEDSSGHNMSSIAVLSISWGEALPLDSSGQPTGSVTRQDVRFDIPLSSASPLLVQVVADDQSFRQATYTLPGPADQPPNYSAWIFTNVVVSGYSIVATPGGGAAEEITLHFDKATEEYRPLNSDGTLGQGVASSIDFTSNGESAIAAAAATAPTTSAAAPGTISLTLNGVLWPASSALAVQSFSWGEALPLDSAGEPSGRVAIQDVRFDIPLSMASPLLVAAVDTNESFRQAVFTFQSGGDQPQNYLTWTFTNAALSSYSIAADPNGGAVEEVNLHFGKATEAYQSFNADGTAGQQRSASIDFSSAREVVIAPAAATPPATFTATPGTISLTLNGVRWPAASPLAVQSFSWGEALPRDSSGQVSGKVTRQDVRFDIPFGMLSPLLFQAVGTNESFTQAVFTFQSGGDQPRTYLTWTFTDVVLSSYRSVVAPGGGAVDQLTLQFGEATEEYQPFNSDGTPRTPVQTSIDFRIA